MGFLTRLLLAAVLALSVTSVARAVDTISSTTVRNAGSTFGSTYAFLFGNASDGTGESAVKKVDISTLNGAPTKVRITKMKWSVRGMNVSILFDHTTDDRVAILTGNGEMNEDDDGPILDPASAGDTGDVLFTTQQSTDTARPGYTIYMELKKVL